MGGGKIMRASREVEGRRIVFVRVRVLACVCVCVCVGAGGVYG